MVGDTNLLIGVTHHFIVRYEGIYPYSISDAVDIPRLGTLPRRRSKQVNPHCATFGTKCKDPGKVFLHPKCEVNAQYMHLPYALTSSVLGAGRAAFSDSIVYS